MGGGALPSSWSLGHTPSDAEVARVDIDILPDGRGLPPGSGSVAQGEVVYQTKCAVCHGDQGQGTDIPGVGVLISTDPVVGFRRRSVGQFWPHATTAFDYIRRAMPWDQPGTLRDDEVYAVVAYILAESGVISDDTVLDATSLPGIAMPSADRFVLDDRTDGPTIR